MKTTELRTEKLLRVFASSGALKIAQTFLSVIIGVLLARFLEPSGYGRYIFALAVINLLAIPAQSGLPTLLVREVARLSASERWGEMKRLLLWSGKVVVAVSAILLVVPVLFHRTLELAMGGETFDVFVLGLPLVPILALAYARAGVVKGLSHVVQGQLPELIVLPGLLAVSFFAAGSMGYLTPTSAMFLHTMAAALSFVFGAFVLSRVLPAAVRVARPVSGDPVVWMRSMIPLSAIAGLQVLNGQIDVAVLGLFREEADVGVYRVASQGALVVSIALMAVNGAMGPYISRLYYENSLERLQKLVTLSARVVSVVSFPLALVLVVWGEEVVHFIFGAGYEDASLPLAILCVGQLVNAATGSVAYLLNMTGHERHTARVVFCAAVFNVALNVVLVPLFGIIGAAVATTISVCIVNMYLYWVVYRLIKIDCSVIPVLSFMAKIK